MLPSREENLAGNRATPVQSTERIRPLPRDLAPGPTAPALRLDGVERAEPHLRGLAATDGVATVYDVVGDAADTELRRLPPALSHVSRAGVADEERADLLRVEADAGSLGALATRSKSKRTPSGSPAATMWAKARLISSSPPNLSSANALRQAPGGHLRPKL